jgi:hypothetical protein
VRAGRVWARVHRHSLTSGPACRDRSTENAAVCQESGRFKQEPAGRPCIRPPSAQSQRPAGVWGRVRWPAETRPSLEEHRGIAAGLPRPKGT